METPSPDPDPLIGQLKQLLADRFCLTPGTASELTEDEPLLGGRLGLDSLDALELGLQLEEMFGLTLASAAESHRAFASLGHLSRCIRQQGRDRRNASDQWAHSSSVLRPHPTLAASFGHGRAEQTPQAGNSFAYLSTGGGPSINPPTP